MKFTSLGVCIISAQSLILIKLPDETNIGGMVLDDGWCQLTALDPTYPKDVPLYKSPQFNVGTVELDPYAVTGSEKPSLGTVEFDPYAVTGSEKPSLGTVEFDPYAVTGSEKPSLGTVELDPYAVTGSDKPSQGGGVKKFNIKVNVWFSPGKTHCGLHNHHTDPEMLEVHTQIYGTGRMQKFHDNDFKSMYEDVIMAPGFTHDPFTGVKENGDLFYGWHQYYCDTNCIWMAIEHHPA